MVRRLLATPPWDPTEGHYVDPLDALAGESRDARLMSAQWRESRILRVDRRAPLTTPSGKILHLVAASTTRSGAS